MKTKFELNEYELRMYQVPKMKKVVHEFKKLVNVDKIFSNAFHEANADEMIFKSIPLVATFEIGLDEQPMVTINGYIVGKKNMYKFSCVYYIAEESCLPEISAYTTNIDAMFEKVEG